MGLLVGGLMDLYILAHGAVMALYRCILRVGEGLNKKMLLCAILFDFLLKSGPHLSSSSYTLWCTPQYTLWRTKQWDRDTRTLPLYSVPPP